MKESYEFVSHKDGKSFGEDSDYPTVVEARVR